MSPRPPRKPGGKPPWREIEWPRSETRAVESGPQQSAGPESADDAAEPSETRPRGARRNEPDPRRKALALLTRREHSRRELTRKLSQRGFDTAQAEAAVAEMAERGWQNDGRFAESMARSRALSGHGPLRIRAELQQHGIEAAEIAQALEAALEAIGMDWPDWACDVLQRRFGTDAPESQRETARRGAFLQRRGFDMEAVARALRWRGA